MNRLNKILLSFVLPTLCLLISVSNAEIIQANTTYNQANGSSNEFSSIYGYSYTNISNIINNYFLDGGPEDVTAYTSFVESLSSQNVYYIIGKVTASSLKPYYIYMWKYELIDAGYDDTNKILLLNAYSCGANEIYHVNYNYSKGTLTHYKFGNCRLFLSVPNLIETNYPLKAINCPTTTSATWDGTSYYKLNDDTPSLPSNAEIASAVQAFYNTIYNQPNIAFDDFIVLYDVKTKLYSYIGHTRGNAIGQTIVEPNGYYNGYKFDTQWWQFFLDEQNDSFEWQNITKYNNYYLYTSQGDIDTLEFVGQDKIDNLFTSGPWATSNTIIVYSTNDYPVKYITFSDESPDPVVEEGTIKGDQYTYDENLDITDNQYNPLDNFVTIDPTITIIGNVDFDEINKVFEENKNILIIENANWLFSANNQLFNYFSGFILFLIVLIIISRLLGG